MPRKKKVNEDQILSAVLNILDESGIQELTIQNLAKKLNIKAPSLYNHIDGFNQLQEDVTEVVMNEMKQMMDEAANGRDKKEVLLEVAKAYRGYALKYPGRYQFSVVYPSNPESEWGLAHIGMRDLMGEIIRNHYNLPEPLVRSSARALRSVMHGFILFELTGGWTNIVDIETSYFDSINIAINGIDALNARE